MMKEFDTPSVAGHTFDVRLVNQQRKAMGLEPLPDDAALDAVNPKQDTAV